MVLRRLSFSRRFFVFCVAVSVALSFSCASQNDIQYLKDRHNAERFYEEKNYEESLKAYSRILDYARKKNDTGLQLSTLEAMAAALEKNGQIVDAENALKQRVELARLNSVDTDLKIRTYYNLATFYVMQNDCESAHLVAVELKTPEVGLVSKEVPSETVTLLDDILDLRCPKM